MFAREGYPFLLGVAVLAALTFAAALRLRSWPWWLAGYVLTLVALVAAWASRTPVGIPT
ncbi:hypothetical protein [Gemmatimonas groenlandica]|uniref:Uncharacterized protein n=1 Tax=Gemmatimonas groenlandica TaxID=2732249 RepID=A0A6M4IND3_9BACT|nr:hypothetical protein [Gemmatimonas groenlandica]QJR34977.1 hypothetical protein HKW67_05350 [Gemmatimonas groenlandica]